jgi:hypothetical protein
MLLEDGGVESNDTRSITIEIKKIVCAITAALPAITPNPKTPVISAMIKNIIALRIIKSIFLTRN